MMKNRAVTTRVILHHSLSPDVSANIIRGWHRVRGFEDIGYHFIVRGSGNIETGRAIDLVGAHAYGKNSDSVGVCVTGDFRAHKPTPDQYRALWGLYRKICLYYNTELDIQCHRNTENACPGPLFDRPGTIIRCKERIKDIVFPI